MTIDVKSLVKQGVDLIFTHFESLVEEFLLTEHTEMIYDISQGVISGLEGAYGVNGIILDAEVSLGQYTQDRRMPADGVKMGDKKVLFRRSEIDIIKTSFLVRREKDRSSWIITHFNLDPSESFYEVYLRRSG